MLYDFKMKAELFCLHCNKDTPHTVTYAGKIKSIKCTNTAARIEIRRDKLIENYAIDFIERIFTKPYRMTENLRDLTKFILSLPIG